MRCSEVIQKLSSSTEIPADVAAHLETCDDCALWAEDDAQVLRVWHGSRPVEPSAEAWNAIWSRVSAELDAAARPVVLTLPEASRNRRYRPALIALGLAQAAVILLAAYSLLPGPAPDRALANAKSKPASVRSKFEIESGEVAMLRDKAGKWDKVVVVSATDDTSNQLDGNFALFNAVEGMAELD